PTNIESNNYGCETLIEKVLKINSYSKLKELKKNLRNKNYDKAIELINNLNFQNYLKNSTYFGELTRIENKNFEYNEVKNNRNDDKENIDKEKYYKNDVDKDNVYVDKDKNINNIISSNPEPRAGHQLIFNKDTNKLILYGGWNGIKELGDKYELDLKTKKWSFLGEFEKRSCHKSFIYKNDFYTLGRYVVINDRNQINDGVKGNVIYKNHHTCVLNDNKNDDNKNDDNKNGDNKNDDNKNDDIKKDDNKKDDNKNDDNKNDDNKKDDNKNDDIKNDDNKKDDIKNDDNKNDDNKNDDNKTDDIKNDDKTITIPLFDEIYDHQIEIENNDIYIVGGKCLYGNKSFYNGILRTNLESKETEILLNESTYDMDSTSNNINSTVNDNQIPNIKFIGRSGHSLMIVNIDELKNNAYDKMKEDISRIYGSENNTNYKNHYPKTINSPTSLLYNFNDTLIIIGGQKNKESFNEMLFFNTKEKRIYLSIPLPIKNIKFVQRSVLVCDEIFTIFCINSDDGYDGEVYDDNNFNNNDNPNPDDFNYNNINSEFTHSRLFFFSLKTFIWKEIKINIPFIPRSSFQFLYAGYFFLYGGLNKKRMGDFYQLRLKKESEDDIKSKLILKIHKLKITDILDNNNAYKNKKYENKDKVESIDQAENNYQVKNNHVHDDNYNESKIIALNYLKSVRDTIPDSDYKKCCIDLLANNFNYSIDDVLNDVSKYLDEDLADPEDSIEDYFE
ncbi:hypothetical protein DMUE_5334, partial [Dictyocoela muelleri]